MVLETYQNLIAAIKETKFDLKAYETLIDITMTESHEQYEQAMEDFSEFIDTEPGIQARKLAYVVQQSTIVQIRCGSADLLQILFEHYFQSLAECTKDFVMCSLLRCLEKEKERIVIKSLCDSIATGYSVFSGEDRWPKVFPFIVQCVSGNNDVLQEAAVLLFANLLHKSTNVDIRKLFETPIKRVVEHILIRSVEKEDDKIVWKRLCHMIVTVFNEFYSMSDIENVWPDLYSFLCRAVCVSGRLQEAAVLILGSLKHVGEVPPNSLEMYSTFLSNVACSVDIRKAAFGAALTYIRCKPNVRTDVCLVPAMMQVLTAGLKGGQEVMTQEALTQEALTQEALTKEALKLLIQWAHDHNDKCLMGSHSINFSPWEDFDFVVPWEEIGFVGSAFEISESQRLEKETRHLAIDFLITMLERDQFIFQFCSGEFPNASNRLFGLLMLMLSDIENAGVVLEFLKRLATIESCVLERYLATSESSKSVAAIVALPKFFEAYLQATKKNFSQLVTVVLDLFQDRDPCVRSAAIEATGQLFTKLDPDLQLQHHLRVLRALDTAIYDFRFPKVQAHAVTAVANVINNLTPDILAPYLYETLDTMLQSLFPRNDLAVDQSIAPRIKLLRQFRDPTIKLLRLFRQEISHDTWVSIWPTLHPAKSVALISNQVLH